VVGFLITIGGKGLQEGVDWTAQGTVAGDATEIANAINTNTATTLATATAVGATVTITANTAGTAGNAIVITVSTGGHTSQSGATLAGGAAQSGALAFSGPGRVKTVVVQATGANSLGCQVLDGLTSGGTE
jgi:phage tail sheath gpL-like